LCHFTVRESIAKYSVADIGGQDVGGIADLNLSATKMRLYRAIDKLRELATDILGRGSAE